ncbi:MAG: pitrilysin family protein [Chloroflexota bacterium]
MSARRRTPAGVLRSLPGPENIHREVLPNGITVLARSNFSSPSATISGYIKTGSMLDSNARLGLADFTVSALMRGTRRHSFDALYGTLESVGANMGFDSGMNTTGFHGHALVEDLPLLVRLLSEVLREPTFPTREVEKLRHHLLTGLAIRAQDTADMADLLFDGILYRGHPYARPEDGTPRTIKAIEREDLTRFHRRSFGPVGMVIVVVGAVEPKRAAAVVRRALGSWRNPGQVECEPPADPPPLRATTRRHHKIIGKAQADIIIGTNGPRRTDPQWLAASLGNSVLGQFGMMGRVGKSLREESGLAYYAYSNLSSGMGPGAWTVSAGVNPANVERASDLVIRELRRFVDKGVTRDELADSQANFVGRLPLSLESNAGVASALLNIERYQLGLDYYQRYAQKIQAITRTQVLDAARKFINPHRLVVATAGP